MAIKNTAFTIFLILTTVWFPLVSSSQSGLASENMDKTAKVVSLAYDVPRTFGDVGLLGSARRVPTGPDPIHHSGSPIKRPMD